MNNLEDESSGELEFCSPAEDLAISQYFASYKAKREQRQKKLCTPIEKNSTADTMPVETNFMMDVMEERSGSSDDNSLRSFQPKTKENQGNTRSKSSSQKNKPKHNPKPKLELRLESKLHRVEYSFATKRGSKGVRNFSTRLLFKLKKEIKYFLHRRINSCKNKEPREDSGTEYTSWEESDFEYGTSITNTQCQYVIDCQNSQEGAESNAVPMENPCFPNLEKEGGEMFSTSLGGTTNGLEPKQRASFESLDYLYRKKIKRALSQCPIFKLEARKARSKLHVPHSSCVDRTKKQHKSTKFDKRSAPIDLPCTSQTGKRNPKSDYSPFGKAKFPHPAPQNKKPKRMESKYQALIDSLLPPGPKNNKSINLKTRTKQMENLLLFATQNDKVATKKMLNTSKFLKKNYLADDADGGDFRSLKTILLAPNTPYKRAKNVENIQGSKPRDVRFTKSDIARKSISNTNDYTKREKMNNYRQSITGNSAEIEKTFGSLGGVKRAHTTTGRLPTLSQINKGPNIKITARKPMTAKQEISVNERQMLPVRPFTTNPQEEVKSINNPLKTETKLQLADKKPNIVNEITENAQNQSVWNKEYKSETKLQPLRPLSVNKQENVKQCDELTERNKEQLTARPSTQAEEVTKTEVKLPVRPFSVNKQKITKPKVSEENKEQLPMQPIEVNNKLTKKEIRIQPMTPLKNQKNTICNEIPEKVEQPERTHTAKQQTSEPVQQLSANKQTNIPSNETDKEHLRPSTTKSQKEVQAGSEIQLLSVPAKIIKHIKPCKTLPKKAQDQQQQKSVKASLRNSEIKVQPVRPNVNQIYKKIERPSVKGKNQPERPQTAKEHKFIKLHNNVYKIELKLQPVELIPVQKQKNIKPGNKILGKEQPERSHAAKEHKGLKVGQRKYQSKIKLQTVEPVTLQKQKDSSKVSNEVQLEKRWFTARPNSKQCNQLNKNEINLQPVQLITDDRLKRIKPPKQQNGQNHKPRQLHMTKQNEGLKLNRQYKYNRKLQPVTANKQNKIKPYGGKISGKDQQHSHKGKEYNCLKVWNERCNNEVTLLPLIEHINEKLCKELPDHRPFLVRSSVQKPKVTQVSNKLTQTDRIFQPQFAAKKKINLKTSNQISLKGKEKQTLLAVKNQECEKFSRNVFKTKLQPMRALAIRKETNVKLGNETTKIGKQRLSNSPIKLKTRFNMEQQQKVKSINKLTQTDRKLSRNACKKRGLENKSTFRCAGKVKKSTTKKGILIKKMGWKRYKLPRNNSQKWERYRGVKATVDTKTDIVPQQSLMRSVFKHLTSKLQVFNEATKQFIAASLSQVCNFDFSIISPRSFPRLGLPLVNPNPKPSQLCSSVKEWRPNSEKEANQVNKRRTPVNPEIEENWNEIRKWRRISESYANFFSGLMSQSSQNTQPFVSPDSSTSSYPMPPNESSQQRTQLQDSPTTSEPKLGPYTGEIVYIPKLWSDDDSD